VNPANVGRQFRSDSTELAEVLALRVFGDGRPILVRHTLSLRSTRFEHDALEFVQLIGIQDLFYFLAFRFHQVG
jgi:hypothetical protein